MIFSVSLLFGEHIHWFGKYNIALENAKQNNKPLMVLLVEGGSASSKMIVAKLFTNKPYVGQLNRKVVSVLVDVNTKTNYPNEMLWSNTYPKIFFLNSDNEIFLHPVLDASTTPDELLRVIKALN